MKKTITLFLAALALVALAASCSKEPVAPADEIVEQPADPAGPVTISATLADSYTRVEFSLGTDGDGNPYIILQWKNDDKLVVTSNTGQTSEFAIVSDSISPDGKTADFTGTLPEGGAPYTVSMGSVGGDSGICQLADADPSLLQYAAIAENVTDISNVSLTTLSGVLGIVAKLPEGVAGKIERVELQASEPVFLGAFGLMTIDLETKGDVDDDGILNLYVTLPTTEIPAGTSLFLRFHADDESHDVYTRYQEFDSAVTLPAGKFNVLKFDCTKSDRHAGKKSCTGDSADDPYLIADKYQLKAVNDEMEDDVTKYFKMIDDVDMDEENWTHLNATKVDNDYKKKVDFNGNNKTISHLNKDLFYVLKGSVYDLTLDVCDVDARGILAEYIQGTGNSVTNITISNGKLSYTGQAESDKGTGGLIGTINNGSGTVATIANCVVSNTNVTGKGVVGGVIGFADQLISMSGCSYTDGTVTATARYAGGMIASTSNYSSVISDCHVENATITSSSDRFGGFAGLLHTKVVVKGCSVGTSLQRVIVNSTQTTATANAGGFAGVNYGKITQNEDIRSKAYVAVKSSNVTIGNSMNIGGFVGYNTGTIEYCDADVMMPELKGQYIGGFCGVILQSGVIKNSTETGIVTGNNYTGGFVGAIDSATTKIEDCTSAGSVSAASSIGGFAGGCTALGKSGYFANNSSSASVTSSGSNFGGFIGNGVGSFISNFATGNVVSTGGGNGGGFAGGIWEKSTGSVFSKNYATGSVSGNANLGGLIGYIGGNLDMSNCYATGNVGTSNQLNQKYGGLVGFTTDKAENSTSITISNCYAIGDVEASFASAGLIGRIGLASCSVSNCAAWNSKVFPHTTGSANWSSAAVVGVAFPTCTLTNNYRNPSMDLTAYWVPADMTTFQHADVSSDHPLTDSTGAEMTDSACASGQPHYPQYPYHGKVEAGKTLSQLASTTLGWSGDVWDFSGPLPLLK